MEKDIENDFLEWIESSNLDYDLNSLTSIEISCLWDLYYAQIQEIDEKYVL